MGRHKFSSFLFVVAMLAAVTPLAWSQQRAPVRQPANPPATQPRVLTRAQGAVVPPGFPLSAQQQARVDQILTYWEHHTSKIETFQCKFIRRNYDFVFGRKETPKSLDVGTIRFKSPDKGLMRVDKVYELNPQAVDPKQQFEQKDVQFGEYWVCDGQSIYQFDARTKVLTETQLPPELRGKAIAEGPLPFLFGAKATTMTARYWIREVTPPDNPQGEYFLEATPKRQEDAANFDRLLVKMKLEDGQLFPRAMKVEKGKQGYVQYEFQDHVPNAAVHRVQGFLNSFVRPKTPAGWTKVVEDWQADGLDPRQATNPKAPPQTPGATDRR